MRLFPDYKSIREAHSNAVADALIKGVASSDFDGKAFAKRIACEHRTHQQSVMRAVAYLLDEFAKSEHDGRNQATVEFCKEINPTLNQYVFPYI